MVYNLKCDFVQSITNSKKFIGCFKKNEEKLTVAQILAFNKIYVGAARAEERLYIFDAYKKRYEETALKLFGELEPIDFSKQSKKLLTKPDEVTASHELKEPTQEWEELAIKIS